MTAFLVIIKFLILLVLILICYCILDIFADADIQKSIREGLDRLTQVERTAMFEIEKKKYYISEKKGRRFKKHIRILIKKSGLNSKIVIMNPTIFVILSLALAVILGNAAYKMLYMAAPSVLVAVIGLLIPYYVLIFLAENNSRYVDRQAIDFINILMNLCTINNDIVSAIKNSTPYLKEPIRGYCDDFKYDVDHRVTPFDALDRIAVKVDNPQLKLLFKNLKACNKHSGEYYKTLKKSKDLYLKYYKQYEKKKKEALAGRISLAMMTIMDILIIVSLNSINPELLSQLRNDSIGRFIVTFIIFGFMVTFIIMINISKFEY